MFIAFHAPYPFVLDEPYELVFTFYRLYRFFAIPAPARIDSAFANDNTIELLNDSRPVGAYPFLSRLKKHL